MKKKYYQFYYKGFEFNFYTENLNDLSFEQTFYSNLTQEQKENVDRILETYLKSIDDKYVCPSDSVVCIREFSAPIQVSF